MSTSTLKTHGVDYFLWNQDEKTPGRLVYYDNQGNCYERDLPKERIDAALKLFDGKPRSILRSTGGRVNAEPIQIVVSEPDSDAPQIRIRVKFCDLIRNVDGDVIGNQIAIHTKVVSIEDLGDPVPQVANHSYVMDFGSGLVPIRVIHFEKDKRTTMARFVLATEVDAAAERPGGQTAWLQTYLAPVQTLRLATDHHGVMEFALAEENVKWKIQLGERIIPTCLADGSIEVPCGATQHLIEQVLQLCASGGQNLAQPLIISILTNTRELLPFGSLEPVG